MVGSSMSLGTLARRCTAAVAFLLVSLAWAGTAAAVTVSDNNLHIDRGITYTNQAFLTAAAGTAPYTYTLNSGSLPLGIVLNSNGTLSGMTCGTNGKFDFFATATDSLGVSSASTKLALIVNASPSACSLTVSPASLPNGNQNLAYPTQAITASGGTAPYSFAVVSGTLPTGLSLTSGGVLSGTPTAAGSFTFTVRATDAVGATGNATYTVTIAPAPTITVSPASLPNANRSLAYSQTITASGGTAPYTFSVTAGSLPAGLSLSSGGALSGTPTVSGTFNFTVTATDSLTYTGARAYTLNVVAAPTITVSPASLPSANEGLAYSQTITAAGGTGPYTFAVTAGSLPAGLTLAANGTLSGTPTASGTFNFTVTATDSLTYTGARAYTLNVVAAPTITVSPASLPDANENLAYSQTITASGGTGPYTFAVTAGSLPGGLTLSSSGALSGTPTVNGTFNFTVTATDSLTYTGSRAYTLAVDPAATISVAPPSLPVALEDMPYSQTITASGGTAPYAFAVTAGSLPAGLSLSSSGALSGTPTASGTFNFTVTATDANGYTGDQAYSLGVTPAPTITVSPASLPNGQQNLAYSQAITASGGTGPYTYDLSGSLPPGVTLDSGTGVLSGTPTASGTFNLSVDATDANGYAGSQSYSWVVDPAAAITISPPTLPAGQVGLAYSQTLAASGGTAPYAYAVTSGSLPAGVTLSTGGVLSGTPTVAGSFSFTVTATDADTYTGGQSYSLTVNAAPTILVSPSTLPNGSEALGYSQTITASGGTAPYTFALTSGALPAGMTLSAGGALSGIPAANGTFNFTVTATDADGYTGSQAYSWVVDPIPAITLSPASLPAGQAGVAYNQSVTASGGTAPYTFAVTAGSLPAGLSLSSGGALSGTPTATGTFNFTITATDADSYTGSRAYSIAVSTTPTIVLAPSTLPNGSQDLAYPAQTITASGGTAPYSFAVTAGSLPAGLSLASDGTLSGTPTSAGTFNFTVSATDAASYTGTQAYSIVIAAAPTIVLSSSVPSSIANNAAITGSVSASGGTAPYTYAVTSGSLPAGITLASDGSMSGSSTATGSYNYTVTATDANGYSASQAYTLGVGAPLAAQSNDPIPAVTVGGPAVSFVPVVATGGAGGYQYSISPGLPAGLTFDTATGTISGTATAASPLATYTVTVTDLSGATASQTFSMGVSSSSLAVGPGSADLGTEGSEVDVQFTATGGTAPYTYAMTGGALPPGVTLASDGRLSGTTTQAGTFVFTLQVTDANGNTVSRQISLVVDGRPDPTLDPSVGNAVAAQADAMRRFAFAQTQNANNRLEQIRSCHDTVAAMQVQIEGQGGFDAASGDGREAPVCDRPVAFWLSGTFIYGEDGNGPTVRTPGVTAGADLRMNDRLVLGLGIGAGYDSTDPGRGADNTGQSYSLLGYGSWSLAESLRLEGVLGYSSASIESTRTTAYDGTRVKGTRDADQVFGSLTLAGDLLFGRFSVQPYLRADYENSKLHDYREKGDGMLSLRYYGMSSVGTQLTGGMRGLWSIPTGFGVLQPMLRLEYRSLEGNDLRQPIGYADGIGGQYMLVLDGPGDDFGVVGVGLGFMLTGGAAGSIEWQSSFGGDMPADNAFTADVSWAF